MNKFLNCTCGEKGRDLAFLFLRVVTGLAFFTHGYAKVFTNGIDGVTGFFTNVGIPLAGLVAPLVAYGELLGGLALMLGFLSHWVAKAFTLIILGAIGFVHFENGYGAEGGYEYSLILLAASLFFVAYGSGKYSVDAKLRSNQN